MIILLGSTRRNAPGPHSSWHLGAISEFQIKEEPHGTTMSTSVAGGLGSFFIRFLEERNPCKGFCAFSEICMDYSLCGYRFFQTMQFNPFG